MNTTFLGNDLAKNVVQLRPVDKSDCGARLSEELVTGRGKVQRVRLRETSSAAVDEVVAERVVVAGAAARVKRSPCAKVAPRKRMAQVNREVAGASPMSQGSEG